MGPLEKLGLDKVMVGGRVGDMMGIVASKGKHKGADFVAQQVKPWPGTTPSHNPGYSTSDPASRLCSWEGRG